MEIGIILAVVTMGGLGFVLAGGLAIADKKLHVEENPLIAQINEILPNANCGGCGKAGCYDFAVNVVDGKVPVNGCPVGGNDTAIKIAELLGVKAVESIKNIPVLLCRGGNNEAVRKMAEYYGPLSCKAMQVVSGGNKLCYYGCLGGGDCVTACPFGAITMSDNGLPYIVEELCTGCGLCVTACPRNVLEMHPINREVFVFCKNHDDPKRSKEVCSAACIGCGICSRKLDAGIVMEKHLSKVVHELLDESKITFDKCSTGAFNYKSNKQTKAN
jgi:Na+-translocating ferredoxin:NAD+ oxidoreductase RNF subunit RnfB